MLPMPAHGPDRPSEVPSQDFVALLLVEQDDGLRRFLFWALYLDGFKVLTARDMKDALRLSRDIAGPIELLIIGSLPFASSAAELQQQIERERAELRTIMLDELTNPESLGQPETGPAPPARELESLSAGVLIQRIRKMIADR